MLFLALGTPQLLRVAMAIILVFLFPLLILSSIIFYRLLLHPLCCIPGPRLAAISNTWHAYHARNGRMLELGKTLHKIYGPVVRVGPNEVWFDSKDAFKTIYSPGSGFKKSDFYIATALRKPRVVWRLPFNFALEYPDTLDFLSETERTRYRLQRRLIGPVYHTSNLKKFDQAVDSVLEQAIAQLRTLNSAEVDLKEWMHIIAVECLGAVVLSWSPGYLRDMSDRGSSGHSYLGWRRKSVFGLFPGAAVVEILSNSLGRVFATLWGLNYKPPKNFKPFFPGVSQKTTRRLRLGLAENPRKDDRNDLIADLIQLHKIKPEFTETYLRRMAVTNFGAGHETMCSALTSAVAMIGSHSQVQRRVIEEVRNSSMTHDRILRLPYTMASIKEAQRLHPAIAMSLSRTVPAEGMHAHGYHFPPGTTVGCNPVALHRNPDIFGVNADTFNPDRWLADESSNARRVMERYNLTWGGGARTCPGKYLAELIVFKAVAALMKDFDVDITLPPEDEIHYYFMAMLTGVKARFVPKGDRSMMSGQS